MRCGVSDTKSLIAYYACIKWVIWLRSICNGGKLDGLRSRQMQVFCIKARKKTYPFAKRVGKAHTRPHFKASLI